MSKDIRTFFDMDREIQELTKEVLKLRLALNEIRDRMGGDNLDGWDGPEDVWGIASDALGLIP